jgi:hypothetical protein
LLSTLPQRTGARVSSPLQLGANEGVVLLIG